MNLLRSDTLSPVSAARDDQAPNNIYQLHPLVAGPLDTWAATFSRIAAMGFSHLCLAPPFEPGGSGDIFIHATFDHLHPALRFGGSAEQGLKLAADLAARAGLTMIPLACQWNLAHPAVRCVAPTLIQELGPQARPIEDKRAELAALPDHIRLSDADVDEIRALGDNTGCMALKGASPEHDGEQRPDRWPVDDRLEGVARRWQIEPDRDLVRAQG